MRKYSKAWSKPETLTQREENFCQAFVVKGMTATDAYLTAFDTKNRKTASNSAKDLKKRPRVAKRIEELREKMAYEMSWSKEKAERSLTDIVETSLADGSTGAMKNAISAIQELNKMCGYHAPVKSAHMNIEVGAGDIDAIMLNLGFKRTSLLEASDEQGY